MAALTSVSPVNVHRTGISLGLIIHPQFHYQTLLMSSKEQLAFSIHSLGKCILDFQRSPFTNASELTFFECLLWARGCFVLMAWHAWPHLILFTSHSSFMRQVLLIPIWWMERLRHHEIKLQRWCQSHTWVSPFPRCYCSIKLTFENRPHFWVGLGRTMFVWHISETKTYNRTVLWTVCPCLSLERKSDFSHTNHWLGK